MTKTIGMVRKIGLGAAIGGLVLGMAQVSAETFDANVSVQNTLALRVVQGMEFGTLFAGGVNNKTIAGLTLSPEGLITQATAIPIAVTVTATDTPQFFSLGGHSAARGSVASSRDFVVSVPDQPATALVVDNAFVPAAGTALKVNDDPTEPAFYLAGFTVGSVVGGTPTEGTGGAWDIDVDFGVTEVEFGIGASIYTDGSFESSGYQETIYTGTFEVTASY